MFNLLVVRNFFPVSGYTTLSLEIGFLLGFGEVLNKSPGFSITNESWRTSSLKLPAIAFRIPSRWQDAAV
jgi:hypothetical protein